MRAAVPCPKIRLLYVPLAMNTDANRPLETEIMSALERIILRAEEAEALIQDDSRVTGIEDREGLREKMRAIRALTIEVEQALRATGV